MYALKKNLNPKKWFVVYTKSRAEVKVCERLMDAGYESFIPLITEMRQWSDRSKKVKTPLIKSYVFVNVKRIELTLIYAITGVVAVLNHLGEPAMVTDIEINNLKIITNSNEATKALEPFNLQNGEPVQVVQGPFKGLIAVYLLNSKKHRVIVKVEVLNSLIEITVPIHHIKKI